MCSPDELTKLKEKGKTTHSKPLSFRRGAEVRSQADNLSRRDR